LENAVLRVEPAHLLFLLARPVLESVLCITSELGSSMSSPWLNFGLLQQTSSLWSKAKDCSRYSALERSQGLGLQDN
jgi:hypothetical protein